VIIDLTLRRFWCSIKFNIKFKAPGTNNRSSEKLYSDMENIITEYPHFFTATSR